MVLVTIIRVFLTNVRAQVSTIPSPLLDMERKMECGIGRHCALVECTKSGSASPAPQAPPPATIPANHICDISKVYGNANITGNYKLTTTIGDKKYVADV